MRYDDDYDTDDLPRALPHSGLGIASLAITFLMGLFEFVVIMIAGILESTTEGGVDENSPEAMLLGLSVLGGMMLNFVGIGLGIGGLCQSNRSKIFPALGVCLGIVVIFGVVSVIVLGVMFG